MKKYLGIFLMMMLLFTSLSTSVMADDGTAALIGQKGTEIVNAILWFGYAIALGMVVFIGIKYILGSAEAKSNMKSAIVSWFIGAFIVFACTTIITWVLNVINAGGGEDIASGIINAVDKAE